MTSKQFNRDGFVRLEVLLVLAILALLFQVFPALWHGIVWALDVRNWSRGVWMTLNVAIVVGLVGIRIGPQLYEGWRTWSGRRSAKRESDEKRRTIKEERALYERMREARKRQVV